MTIKEMKGDTCNACKHRQLRLRSCEKCGRPYNHLPAMPYCKKNGIWLIETEMAPCQYFKRDMIWTIEINNLDLIGYDDYE